MRVIFNEVKKIFNAKMVMLLLFINIIVYFLFIEFHIKYFPNGPAEETIYNMVVEMKQKYGTYMDESEFEDFKREYDDQVEIINKDIKKNAECKKYNIKSINELYKMEGENLDISFGDKAVKLNNKVVIDKNIKTFLEIDSKKIMIDDYSNRYKTLCDKAGGVENIQDNKNLKKHNRVKEILNSGEDKSILYSGLWNNYRNFIFNTAILILLSVTFMISPIYIKDRKNKVQYLQCTCRTGRKIFNYKVIAALLATFIIATTQLIIMFKLYIKNNIQVFFDSNINSFLNNNIYWYDITFDQYMIITIVATYILAFAFAVMSLLISSKVDKYITLIALQLPIIIFTVKVFLRYLVTCIGGMIFSKYCMPIFYLGIFIVLSILFLLTWRREKVLEIS